MTPRQPTNLPASVKARLQNLSQVNKRDFNQVLTQFATERFLYRIGQSSHARRFVLKGARLLALWSGMASRPTRDLDLLGFGNSTAESVRLAIQEICRTPVLPDGVSFVPASVVVKEIRTEHEYNGQRATLVAFLGKARVPLQVDIGFGDVITPGPVETDYTPLLAGLPAPHIHTYSRDTFIAEKLHAMVFFGEINTRMKDFYDIHVLATEFHFDGTILSQAIRATFDRRNTPVPKDTPVCLQQGFAQSTRSTTLWSGFLNRSGISTTNFSHVVHSLCVFLEPLLQAAAQPGAVLEENWIPGEGWTFVK